MPLLELLSHDHTQQMERTSCHGNVDVQYHDPIYLSPLNIDAGIKPIDQVSADSHRDMVHN